MEIAHIGHIYESLLSLRLALASRPLRYDGKKDRYVPVDENASQDERAARERNAAGAEVQAGELLWQTHEGGRKAGGVYYTPVDLVRHLVERSVLPAFERRLEEAAALANTDATRAARELLEFSVVDPACGSAHFLVQVAETLAERTVRFLAEHNLPLIAEEIGKLRAGAMARADIDDVALLRRLLVKNCVFGVDASPMGAEAAKLSLWLATFVPGLSLAHLGRNVLVGDSLIGVVDAERLQEELELPIFAQKIRQELQEATRRIRSLLEIQDRTPEEVQMSQQADHEAEKAAAGVRRVFDLWTAEQFGLEQARHHVGFHGVDVLDGSGWACSALVAKAGELAGRHGFLHWPLAFPQVFARDRPGFDVVVGNPPWEEVTIEELSFYGLFRPGLNSMEDEERSRVIADMVDERPELPRELERRQADLEQARTALKAGDYPPMAGDSDLYKYFCARYRDLVRAEGYIGVVLPRAAFNTKGSRGFRDWLLGGSTTHRVDFLRNRSRWTFDSDARKSIALVAAERRAPSKEHRVWILGTAESRAQWRQQADAKGVGLLKSAFGPGWETPLLRTQAEADLLAKLRSGTSLFPFGAGGRWQCFPVRELDESKHKPFWLGQTEGQPVWKGESFDQYQPSGRFERVCQARARIKGKITDLEDLLKKPGPGQGSLLAKCERTSLDRRREAVLTELERARVAFRDVSQPDDSRSVRACLVPAHTLLANTAPYLAWVSGAEREQAACLGMMNSLAFDWQVRRFIERHVSFFLLEEVVSYSRFASDEQLADSQRETKRRVLSNAKDAYRLVIFDEAHTLRKPGTTWYRAMSRLLGGPPKDLVLLSATPINNGLWDLYHLVMVFARHDGAFAADGIGSLRKLFVRAGANARDPESLDPDVLFPLAAMVSVRRDRRFIETHYPGASFPDGTPVRFPTPQLSTERYDLDAEYPGLVGIMTDRIGALSMARYRPSSYRLGDAEEPREVVLGALLQSAVLKRFESCWYACLLTIRRMLSAHQAFLHAWERGHVLGKDALTEAAKAELAETAMGQWLDESLDDEDLAESTDRYRPEFAQDVRSDRTRLKEIEALLEALEAGSDPKLRLLRDLLDESPSQKIVVFSTFADTIRYLGDHLPERASDRDRVEVIGAETSPDERTALVARFCPDTVVRPGYEPPEGEVDLLLSNDVLSEGQNLQQAAAVISYDMPWNPQRVVQRYGRVIRLKSPHHEVHLSTMLPERGDLEAILGLEITIRRKIVAAGPYGMEVEVLEPAGDETASDVRSYARRLADGDSTLLDQQDGAAGELVLSTDALRAELRRAVAEGEVERLRKLPWGVGAAFRQGPGVPSRGAPGVFFACRVGESSGASWSYWRYVSGEDVLSEPAQILRRIDPGEAPGIADPPVDIESAWERAVESIVEEHNRDAAAPASESIGPVQRWALTVLADPAAGQPDGAAEAWEVLQVGRSQPERKALGEIKRLLEREEISSTEAARRIVDVTRSYGLRPVEPPAVREPIEESDVGVVCWMAVL